MIKRAKTLLSSKSDYILSCLILFIPKIIMILTASYPITNDDELSIFAIPAKLAGMDWSSTTYQYRYYGYGFSILLTPLFKFIHNPIVLYKTTLIIVLCVQLIIPIISCYLLQTFFPVKRRWQVVLISTICIYGETMCPTYMYNEHLYIAWVWVSFLVLAILWTLPERDKKNRVKYSIFLGLSFIGALTVHQRALTLFLGCIILYFFMLFVLKKRTFYILPVAIIYIIGNYVNTKIMSYFIKIIKYDSAVESGVQTEIDLSKIQNTSVEMAFSWKALRDKDYIQAVVRTFMGNLNNLNIFTVGIAFFAFVLGISFLIKIYKKEISGDEQKLFYFGIFGIVCVFITIAGLANTWGWGIKYAYVNKEASYDSLRGLTYTRYYIAYFPPLMLGILSYICNHVRVYIKLFRYTILLSVIGMHYYLARIAPLMKKEKIGFGSLSIYTPYAYKGGEILPFYYLFGASVFLCLIVALYYLLKNKKVWIYLLIISCSFLWRCTYIAYFRPTKDINFKCVDQSSNILRKMEEENVNVPIYVSSSSIRKTSQTLLYEMQFMNMRTKLGRGYPKEDLEEAVFVTIYPKEDTELLDKGYVCIKLDEEEYMYVKGEEVIQFVQNILEETSYEKSSLN